MLVIISIRPSIHTSIHIHTHPTTMAEQARLVAASSLQEMQEMARAIVQPRFLPADAAWHQQDIVRDVRWGCSGR